MQADELRNADPRQLEALTERLSAHLQKTPDDAEGWALLGRALLSQNRYEQAAKALARAVQLSPEDRERLVEFIKALALAGRAEFEQRNYAAAIGYWERILPFAAPESEFARSVSESIAEARTLSGDAAPAQASAPHPAKPAGAATAAQAIRGVVSLDPKLKGKVAPGDTVFVLARPASGSRMPLAVARTTVDKLPYTFSLDDSMAMSPDAKLSGHATVVVVARVSKSGTAMPQKGDIEGMSAEVKPGDSGVKVQMSTLRD
jgi:cytochrome c-type biogenesis protein CcmH